MLKKFTIYGERCSGTNYLEKIINLNFDVEITWEFGWKHFFGFNDKELEKSDDTLFICIVRNLPDWINSLFRQKYHLPIKDNNSLSYEEKLNIFLNKEFWSLNELVEIMEDRNIYTGERYKNIFELRHTKLKWMIEELPKKVNNYIFIRYEDLINNFENTLHKIKNKRLRYRKNINFPLNIQKYNKIKNNISNEIILNNPNLIPFYEEKLYNLYKNN